MDFKNLSTDSLKTHRVELACAAAAIVLLPAGLIAGGADAIAANPAGGCLLLAGTVALGGLAGAGAVRALEAAPRAAQAARMAELERRPTIEERDALQARAEASETELASARQALHEVTTELAARTQERDDLAAELERATTTARLDQFSDFQLLALADICDAEDAVGYLSRAYGDPAMEQLLALDAVAFDAAQTGEDAKGSRELRWTLKPVWRQAIRAHRMAVDARTERLRIRRGEVVAPQPPKTDGR